MIRQKGYWIGAFSFIAGMASAADGELRAQSEFGPALEAQVLDRHRAGETKQTLNLMDVKASLENNRAINTVNGSNIITGDAFANASGLPVAVQNSGNNVIIQNAFILNLNVK
jgi:hypothetical protein